MMSYYRFASSSISSNLVTFLFLSLLLFSFRFSVEIGFDRVTSHINRNPSLTSHRPHPRRRLDLSSSSASPTSHWLPDDCLLTSIGTLHDDLASHLNHGFLSPSIKPMANGSLLILSSNSSGVEDDADGQQQSAAGEEDAPGGDQESNGSGKLQDDASAFVSLTMLLVAAYLCVFLGFLITYSWACGAVFVAVVNDLVGQPSSVVWDSWDGFKLGLRSFSDPIGLRWLVRDALSFLLSMRFFGRVHDSHALMFFMRQRLMPIYGMVPWVKVYGRDISGTGLLSAWFLIDIVIGGVLAVDPWISVLDLRKSGEEIIKEAFYSIWTRFSEAVILRCVETTFCGIRMQWQLSQSLGPAFAAAFQSTVEVYFLVTWLYFYLGIRCRDANSGRRRFEVTAELEEALRGGR